MLLELRGSGSFGIIPIRRLGSEVLMTQNYVRLSSGRGGWVYDYL